MRNGVTVRVNPQGRGSGSVFVAVSRKIFKKAVDRNLFKRRVRAILLPRLRGSRSSVSVIAGPASADLGFGELKKEILKQLAET